MTTLVTGATGFIGRRLVAMLEERGVRVITTARAVSGRPKAVSSEVPLPQRSEEVRLANVSQLGAKHERCAEGALPSGIAQSSVLGPRSSVQLDLASDAEIELPPGIDTIFHLAGKAHALSETSQDDSEYTRINTDGTRRLLEAAQRAGVRSFVFFSSVKAAGAAAPNCGKGQGQRGKGHQSPITNHESPDSASLFPLTSSRTSDRTTAIDEANDLWPQDAYGRSKRAAEELVLRGAYVPHAVVLRPCLVYGPKPKGNLEKMIAAVRRGRFPPVPEFGNKRSMVHVDDVCAAAIFAAEKPEANGQTYILADDEPFSTRQLFEWISSAVGRPIPRWTMPRWTLDALARTGDLIGRLRGRRFVFDSDALEKLQGDAWYSAAKAKRELGWQPRYSLRESLPEICGTV